MRMWFQVGTSAQKWESLFPRAGTLGHSESDLLVSYINYWIEIGSSPSLPKDIIDLRERGFPREPVEVRNGRKKSRGRSHVMEEWGRGSVRVSIETSHLVGSLLFVCYTGTLVTGMLVQLHSRLSYLVKQQILLTPSLIPTPQAAEEGVFHPAEQPTTSPLCSSLPLSSHSWGQRLHSQSMPGPESQFVKTLSSRTHCTVGANRPEENRFQEETAPVVVVAVEVGPPKSAEGDGLSLFLWSFIPWWVAVLESSWCRLLTPCSLDCKTVTCWWNFHVKFGFCLESCQHNYSYHF